VGKASGDVGSVKIGVEWAGSGVAQLIAATAGSDDVSRAVRAAVLAGDQVFGGALEQQCLSEREAMLFGEGFRVL
jgi:hypothetical protein